ncbi:uncharacterized protein LOC109537841 isoform X3 [Dendroctonus ponderosae]|uniref:uncharacterized protein LOC109537841 isoform X3 n=1 Tax=Dendroctonus ponderosae TaxID=77166 RepID=UPI0020355C90|nr:uncharacterized protein LOC109537841 isoform X3 [Dendroctonus ponderosae]
MPLHLEHGLALLLRSFNINNRLCDGSAWHVPERRPPSPAAMVKTFQAYLPPQCHRTYSCIHCRAHLANHDELISKSKRRMWTGRGTRSSYRATCGS